MDLISRSALLQEFATESEIHKNELWHWTGIKAFIENAPTVEAKAVVHGEWVLHEDLDCVEFIKCSICGDVFYDGDNDTFDVPYNFCPNCGADMRGEKND